jgi:type III secretory pathway lipoprotein EscJ
MIKRLVSNELERIQKDKIMVLVWRELGKQQETPARITTLWANT